MSMLRDLLEPDYLLLQLFVQPADAGHAGVSRPRTYIFCSHTRAGRYLFDVFHAYEMITKAIKATVQTRPSHYLVATKAEILTEAARIARLRKIELREEPRLG